MQELRWFGRGVLVIACPWAFALATPLAVTAALGAASRRGVIINDRRILETLGRVNRVVLDKTGTITEGRLELLGCEMGGRLSFYNALKVALDFQASRLWGIRHGLVVRTRHFPDFTAVRAFLVITRPADLA